MRSRAPVDAGEGGRRTQVPLAPTRPYSWRQTAAALAGWDAAPDRGRAAADGAWLLPVRVPGTPRAAVVELRAGASDEALVATVAWGDLEDGDADGVARELERRLALGLDTAPLQTAAAADPAFAPVAALLRGFHPPLIASVFQAACWTVVRQRTPPSFAHATMERLAALLGPGPLGPAGAPELRLFPAPADMGDEARPQLLAATNNLRKVERLRGLADAFLGVDEAWLRSAPYDEAFRWLVGLPGLGPWSAEQVMWRGLGRYERVPWLDTGALSAVGDLYLRGLTPARGTARELAERYGWLQGLWLRYLKAYPRAAAAAGLPNP